MKKKGSILLETIIVTVILISVLLSFYMIYTKNIINEKQKIYYDDVVYVYKSQLVKELISKHAKYYSDIGETSIKKDVKLSADQYVYGVGLNDKSSHPLFDNDEELSNLRNIYSNTLKTPFIIQIKNIQKLKSCMKSNTDALCPKTINFLKQWYSDIYDYLEPYIKQLNVPIPKNGTDEDYILVTIFARKKNGENSTNSNDYEACLHSKILENKSEFCSGCSDETAISEYYNKDKIRYNMSCETAYYFSWVYYGKL